MYDKISVKVKYYESPCGVLMLGSSAGRICLCDWLEEKHHAMVERRLDRFLNVEFREGTSVALRDATEQLDEFFAGERKGFNVHLFLLGTDFQKKVWGELLKIPYGHTVSYGDMARALGMPGAVRAVANAVGANAVSIFVPCHRVIGSDGSLTGYAGGLDAKFKLLELEGAPFKR